MADFILTCVILNKVKIYSIINSRHTQKKKKTKEKKKKKKRLSSQAWKNWPQLALPEGDVNREITL